MLNPFRALEREHEFVEAARAGVFPAGWLAVSHLIVLIVIAASPGFAVAQLFAAAGCLVAIMIAAGLGWYVWKHQAFWASLCLMLWTVFEVAMTLALGQAAVLGMVLSMIACACCILSLRGTFELRKLRRRGPAINPRVFD
jgi:hypothetical protein